MLEEVAHALAIRNLSAVTEEHSDQRYTIGTMQQRDVGGEIVRSGLDKSRK